MSYYTANPDDIVSEIGAVAGWVGAIFDRDPDDGIYWQHVPKQPKPGDMSVIFEEATVNQETALTYVDLRTWQIIVFGDKESDAQMMDPEVMKRMEAIKKAAIGSARQVIPLSEQDLRYMRISHNGFTMSRPVKTEDGHWAAVGMLMTEVRRAKDYKTYQKIMEAGVRTT